MCSTDSNSGNCQLWGLWTLLLSSWRMMSSWSHPETNVSIFRNPWARGNWLPSSMRSQKLIRKSKKAPDGDGFPAEQLKQSSNMVAPILPSPLDGIYESPGPQRWWVHHHSSSRKEIDAAAATIVGYLHHCKIVGDNLSEKISRRKECTQPI